MEKLMRHENKFMQHFQTLPIFARNILAHILIGGRPIENIIHRRKDALEAQLARRQLATKRSKSQSWFLRVNEVANKSSW